MLAAGNREPAPAIATDRPTPPSMPHVHRRHLVDDAGLAALRRPRDDVVGEEPGKELREPLGDEPGEDASPSSPAGPTASPAVPSAGSPAAPPAGSPARSPTVEVFAAADGPFRRYRRTLTILPATLGRYDVDERTDFSLAAPLWGPVLAVPMALALRRRRPAGRQPWWAPPERLDPRAASVLSLLASLALVSAYLGTLLSQTLTFAAREFGTGKAAQGVVLAAARLGVGVTLAATVAADRVGRRRLLRGSLTIACVVMGLVAAAPGIVWFGAGQTVARALTNAADIIVLVVATEEMPVRARAYAVSVLALVGGLGSGMVVWLLPVTDQGVGAWRLIYLPPLLFLPLVVWAGRHLPESHRFVAAEARARHAGEQRPRFDPQARRRLWLLAIAAFLLLVFASPASQFQNEFLRDERGFSGAKVTVFTLLSGTPAGLGVWFGGRLAESVGRRRIGATGLVGGSVLVALSFLSRGWALWTFSVVGTVVAALTVPAMRVYGPELFPTRLRGRANGVTNVAGVTGSVVGVLLAGALAGPWGGLGRPIALLALGPVAVAVLVLACYPETANRSLEDLNPTDAAPTRTVEADPLPG
jgi:MFS family permease